MKSLGSEVKNWRKFSSGLWGEQRLNFLLGHKESTPCDIPDIQTQSRIREDVWHTHDHIVRKNDQTEQFLWLCPHPTLPSLSFQLASENPLPDWGFHIQSNPWSLLDRCRLLRRDSPAKTEMHYTTTIENVNFYSILHCMRKTDQIGNFYFPLPKFYAYLHKPASQC